MIGCGLHPAERGVGLGGRRLARREGPAGLGQPDQVLRVQQDDGTAAQHGLEVAALVLLKRRTGYGYEDSLLILFWNAWLSRATSTAEMLDPILRTLPALSALAHEFMCVVVPTVAADASMLRAVPSSATHHLLAAPTQTKRFQEAHNAFCWQFKVETCYRVDRIGAAVLIIVQ